ncbi:response regulator [Bradyrhizobium sp. Arg68]|uniref:response regulator transcription factor n=1 Tax=Bradyrhizobium ivorense TaxID=2511166 RepID=UPI001E5B5052|nr:response regulator [Bradyrhizobium ivorense]MCC8935690.1 response regulator [Bradyrhizobium ivorense]
MAAAHLISIVDDDPSMRTAIGGLVRAMGYDAHEFASAEEFLASEDLGSFACTITDIQMPGMNGFELKRQLITLDRSLPVIMITARTEPGLEQQAMASGAMCFLRKPITAETLMSCLEKALAN